jgi:hypothetical protein
MNGLTSKIIPITDLRRKFGEITANLASIDYLILTKGGSPFAILKSAPEEKRKKMMKLAGCFKGTELEGDKIWKEVFKRKSRKGYVRF